MAAVTFQDDALSTLSKLLEFQRKVLTGIDNSGLSPQGLKILLRLEVNDVVEANQNLEFLKREIANAASR